MFNSTIYLRGVPKPIFSSKANAQSVQKIFDDKSFTPDYVVHIGNQSFRKSEIKYIVIENDGNKAIENDRDRDEFYREERANYEKNSRLSAKEKAQKLGLFELLCKSAGMQINQELKDKAIEAQESFFTKNPHRTVCDFAVLKPFIQKDKSKYTEWAGGGIKLAELAIYRDIQLSSSR